MHQEYPAKRGEKIMMKGGKKKRKNIPFESTQEFAFRERNWPVACSEGKAVVRHTYLYLCNLAYRNLLLS